MTPFIVPNIALMILLMAVVISTYAIANPRNVVSNKLATAHAILVVLAASGIMVILYKMIALQMSKV